jgi:allantoin racemase
MRLTVLLPGVPECRDLVGEECAAWVAPGTRLDVVAVDIPVTPMSSRYGIALASPAILGEVARAAESGADGIFITCVADPAVHAAREVVDIPVVGGFQPALFTALSLGHYVGFVGVPARTVPILRELIRYEALGERCRSVGVIEDSDLAPSKRSALIEALHMRASMMLAGGEADVMVLGCTGFTGAATALRDRLEADGPYVPVVDPTGAALLALESAVRLGVRPSRVVYGALSALA